MWRFIKRCAAGCLRRYTLGEEAVFETAENYDRHFDLYGTFETCGYFFC